MNIKLSIIIPIYNQQQYINKCLESITNQTLRNIDIVCVDDGSTDDSLKIVKEFEQKDKRVRIISQRNKGTGIARNIGVMHAKGEYLGFVDADDYVDLDYFEKLYIKAKEEDAQICCALNRRDICGDKVSIVSTPWFEDQKRVKKQLVLTAAHLWSKIFSTGFIKKNGIKNATTRRTQDISFSIPAILLAQKISYVDDTYYNYFIKSESSSHQEITPRDCKEFNNIYDEINSHKYTELYDANTLIGKRYFVDIQYYLTRINLINRILFFNILTSNDKSFTWNGEYQLLYKCAKILTLFKGKH